MKRVLVTGAGGFIGTHLVERLKQDGYWVRGADLKFPEWSESAADEFFQLDLRDYNDALVSCQDIDWVFNLAADMGGMGFITSKQPEIIRNNTQININALEAAREAGVERFLFSSSACVYPVGLQGSEKAQLLKESDAYPAMPQESYGWEKLHMEHLCLAYQDAGWLNAHVVRFHNCYGPRGAWRGGREKAPAALARKIAVAKMSGNPEVEIWGDGEQSRSFMHIDDCTEGLLRLIQSGYHKPVNLGRSRVVTINALADIIARIADVKIEKKHIDGPVGVRSRNSDNSLCREVLLGFEPEIPLEAGMVETYEWIEDQVVVG